MIPCSAAFPPASTSRSQAHPEVGHASLDSLADGALLLDQPGVLVLLEHAHGAAHRHHHVVIAPVRQKIAAVECRDVDLEAACGEHLDVESRRIPLEMLKHQRAQPDLPDAGFDRVTGARGRQPHGVATPSPRGEAYSDSRTAALRSLYMRSRPKSLAAGM